MRALKLKCTARLRYQRVAACTQTRQAGTLTARSQERAGAQRSDSAARAEMLLLTPKCVVARMLFGRIFEFTFAARARYECSSGARKYSNLFLLLYSVCSACCTHSIRILVRPLCTPSNSSVLRSYGISARLRVLKPDGRRALHLLFSLAQLCHPNTLHHICLQ